MSLTCHSLGDFSNITQKSLKMFIKFAKGMKSLDDASNTSQHRIIKTVNEAVWIGWLNLHAAVDALFNEYIGMINAF